MYFHATYPGQLVLNLGLRWAAEDTSSRVKFRNIVEEPGDEALTGLLIMEVLITVPEEIYTSVVLCCD